MDYIEKGKEKKEGKKVREIELSSGVKIDLKVIIWYLQAGKGHWTVKYSSTQSFINTFYHSLI